MWDATKAVPTAKFITLSAYVRNEQALRSVMEVSHPRNPSSYLRRLEERTKSR